MKRSILGVYSANNLPTLPSQRPIGFIANTDPAYYPGRHWVAFFIDTNDTLECFDSYGKPPEILSAYFKPLMLRFKNIVRNKKRVQSAETFVCGQYCLYYLMCRCR